MPLGLICTCGARFEVDGTFAGREVVCPECQTTLPAPTTGPVAARTSLLALFSVILALAGALTIVGTLTATVLGLIAVFQILRDRQRLTGLAFAVAGIVLGIGFTVLTTMVLAGGYLNGLDGRYREALLGDQIDTSGSLDMRRPDKGFTIRRPAADWGSARRARVDDPYVDALRLGKDADLLLVQPARFLFVDVRKETRPAALKVQELNKRYYDRIERLVPNPVRDRDRWNGRPRGWDIKDGGPGRDGEDELDPEEALDATRSGLKPTSVVQRGNAATPAVRDDKDRDIAEATAYESALEIGFSTQTWVLILRHYRKGDAVYIVRAYTQKNRFAAAEAELRQCLDSFRLLP